MGCDANHARGIFWPALIVIILTITAFCYLLVKEKGLVACRLKGSSLVGLLGGILALYLLFSISQASISDIGGPIDLILVVLAYFGGFLASTMLLYSIMGFVKPRSCACQKINLMESIMKIAIPEIKAFLMNQRIHTVMLFTILIRKLVPLLILFWI